MDAPIGTILKHLSENLTMPNQINDKLFSLEYNNNNSKSPQKLASRGLKIIMNSKLKGAIKFKWEFNFKSLDLNLLREHVNYYYFFVSNSDQNFFFDIQSHYTFGGNFTFKILYKIFPTLKQKAHFAHYLQLCRVSAERARIDSFASGQR